MLSADTRTFEQTEIIVMFGVHSLCILKILSHFGGEKVTRLALTYSCVLMCSQE